MSTKNPVNFEMSTGQQREHSSVQNPSDRQPRYMERVNSRVLAAAVNRWPQELRETVHPEWRAELSAIDRDARSKLHSDWKQSRFVWSLFMSAPPQSTRGSWRGLPLFPKDVNTLTGLSIGIGVVFGSAYSLLPVMRASDGPDPWVFFPLLVATGILSVLMYRAGQRWQPQTATHPSIVVNVTVLSSLVTWCLVHSVINGPFSVQGQMDIMVYGLGLIPLLVFGAKAVRKLRDRGLSAWAIALTAVGLYAYFSLPYLWYFMTYLSDVPIGVEFSAFFFPPDSDQEAFSMALVGPSMPITAFFVGRAFGPSDEKETANNPK